MLFRVNFTDNISLTYKLVNHIIVDNWINLINKRTIDDCCKINHYTGIKDKVYIEQRINRVYELIDTINPFVPRKIEKVQLSKENFANALNIMHVHFPEFKGQEGYEKITDYLSEYNDIIHWLEAILPDYFSNNLNDNSQFSIKLDFNKVVPYEVYDIPESAYTLFNGYFTFGQLMLHYVHIGRHAWELFFANDLVCPTSQYIPQSKYNASVRLHFYNNLIENVFIRQQFENRWIDFYKRRGGKDFFNCDVDDPKIRFGYCQIGSLENIKINNIDISIPNTIPLISEFRSKLIKTKIINWEVL